MLCEERGVFLEIADIIRGLGLTILKGVMETRNDKIWAQFAVEVTNKNFGYNLLLVLTIFLGCLSFSMLRICYLKTGKQRCHKDGDIHLTRSPLGANNSKRWSRTCQCC